MKKLLVLGAIIVAGVAANAASFKWSAGNLYASNGTDKFTGDVTLYAVISGVDTAVSTVKASSTGAIAATTFENAALEAGTYYDFFLSYEDAGKQFVSTAKNVQAQATSTANITFGNMQSATQNASNWQSVPEPTSGLLLLLGMAGLALKRKRA
jgi:hypothetical protein